ncbi:MAG: type II secretion system F family protein [Planctomycetota bacterium]
MTSTAWLIYLAFLSFVALLWVLKRRRELLEDRLFEDELARDGELQSRIDSRPWLGHWLTTAGYRGPDAPQRFVFAAVTAILLGAIIAWAIYLSILIDLGLQALLLIPANLGDLFVPVLYAAPLIVFAIVAAVPWLWVRARRRQRVDEVTRDLPIFLELLSTLGEAGLGFDASVAEILSQRRKERALSEELRIYRYENLSGLSRIECLRNLAERVDVPALTMIVSALIQAEEGGASVSEILRRQSQDLRSLRRERARSAAQALTVKLVFPLVLCFLPAIFVAALGPAFHQFAKVAETVIREVR